MTRPQCRPRATFLCSSFFVGLSEVLPLILAVHTSPTPLRPRPKRNPSKAVRRLVSSPGSSAWRCSSPSSRTRRFQAERGRSGVKTHRRDAPKNGTPLGQKREEQPVRVVKTSTRCVSSKEWNERRMERRHLDSCGDWSGW